MKIYILLPVHNRRDITLKFIECLRQQTYQNYHLILIDDGSTDGTSELVRQKIASLTVIRGDGTWWWGGCLQRGYLWLKAKQSERDELVMIINDDTEVAPDFLETAVGLMSGKKKQLLLANRIDQVGGTSLPMGIQINWEELSFECTEAPEHINCLSTRGLFLHLSDMIKIGGFYPHVLPHYLSDYEFTIRAARRGMKLVTDKRLNLFFNETSTGHRQVLFETFGQFMETYYSKRSALNPFYWTVFLALACPWPWKPYNVLRIWKRAAKLTAKACLTIIRNAVK